MIFFQYVLWQKDYRMTDVMRHVLLTALTVVPNRVKMVVQTIVFVDVNMAAQMDAVEPAMAPANKHAQRIAPEDVLQDVRQHARANVKANVHAPVLIAVTTTAHRDAPQHARTPARLRHRNTVHIVPMIAPQNVRQLVRTIVKLRHRRDVLTVQHNVAEIATMNVQTAAGDSVIHRAVVNAKGSAEVLVRWNVHRMLRTLRVHRVAEHVEAHVTRIVLTTAIQLARA